MPLEPHPRIVRVVRHEVGRPEHRGRIHLVSSRYYTGKNQVETFCGLEMWMTRATTRDLDHLEECVICKRVTQHKSILKERM